MEAFIFVICAAIAMNAAYIIGVIVTAKNARKK